MEYWPLRCEKSPWVALAPVTQKFVEHEHVNCIFRNVLDKTAVQHSFGPQTCR